jgi:hypothetical protein
MSYLAVAFIAAIGFVLYVCHRVVFYGLFSSYNPPRGRFFALTRFVLRPFQAVHLWNPSRPTSEIRIAGLLLEGHRHPKISKRLLDRTDPELLVTTVRDYVASPISDVMAEHTHGLLHASGADWEVINVLMVKLVNSPELLLKITFAELEHLSPGSNSELVAYATACSRALTLDVIKALSAGMGLLVSSFAASNLDAPDPIHTLWPSEERSTLGHIIYFMRQLSTQEATFADLIDEISRCVPTQQPGWAFFALFEFRTAALSVTVRYPADGVERLWDATAHLRHHADCIPQAWKLAHAGTPGEFAQLVEVVKALQQQKPAS